MVQIIDKQYEQLEVIGIGHADKPSLLKRMMKDQRPTYSVVLGKPGNNSSKIAFRIGEFDSMYISSCLEGMKTELPLTHELVCLVAKESGLEFKAVNIFLDEGGGMSCQSVFRKSNGTISLKTRISDGISIALYFNGPIYVEVELYNRLRGG